ncbi:hypothetical protein AB0J68_01355 [Micromonospora sp. NPDC049580]|uniref:hypothetical protein n=1 Tax=Micromonospora sp. NPDC049580 TaxID=3154832 RepID=UPI0034225659
MQPQTLPDQQAATIRVAFDVNAGVEPLIVPATTSKTEITDRLRAAFLAADVIDKGHTFDVVYGEELGTVKVLADGNVIEHGSITRSEPDYWLTIAGDLRQAADRIATLAGTPKPTSLTPYLSVSSSYSATDADAAVPIVDAIAAAFGATATTKTEGRGHNRRTQRELQTDCGRIRVRAVAAMPNPPTRHQTRAALEAELEQLRAQLAEGGAR